MNPNLRPRAALSLVPELAVEELVVQELSRFGCRTAAELIASVQAPPHRIIWATTALFIGGTVRFSEDRSGFVLRRTP